MIEYFLSKLPKLDITTSYEKAEWGDNESYYQVCCASYCCGVSIQHLTPSTEVCLEECNDKKICLTYQGNSTEILNTFVRTQYTKQEADLSINYFPVHCRMITKDPFPLQATN